MSAALVRAGLITLMARPPSLRSTMNDIVDQLEAHIFHVHVPLDQHPILRCAFLFPLKNLECIRTAFNEHLIPEQIQRKQKPLSARREFDK
jgi:hypothetical protein